MGLLSEFREFAMRGNVIDLAVGVIIGASFGKITNSLVSDIIMPPIGMLLGQVKMEDLYVALNQASYSKALETSGKSVLTLAEAKAAGIPTINYGVFTMTVLDFVILAFAVFMMIKVMNNLAKTAAGIEIAKAKA